jgi:hypothetical protein
MEYKRGDGILILILLAAVIGSRSQPHQPHIVTVIVDDLGHNDWVMHILKYVHANAS